MHRTATLHLLIAAIFLGCSYHPFLPPGEIVNADAPATLPPGELSMTGSWGEAGGILDYDFATYQMKLRYGLAKGCDVNLGGSILSLLHQGNTWQDYCRNAYGINAGSKLEVLPRFVSVACDAGFGFSDLGNYASMEVDVIAGYENKYVVPFLQCGVYESMPFTPRPHDLSLTTDPRYSHYYTPSETRGLRYALGMKIPITFEGGTQEKLRLYFMLGNSNVQDNSDHHDDFPTLGVSAEWIF